MPTRSITPTAQSNTLAAAPRPDVRHRTSTAASHATLLLRVSLGCVFIAHAWLKFSIYSLPGTAAFFTQHGFPGWTAYPVFLAELIGGVALIVGAYTRWVAVALVPVLVGALSVHWPNGWSFDAPNGGWEYVAFLMAALVVQAGLGDGAYAVTSRFTGRGSA